MKKLLVLILALLLLCSCGVQEEPIIEEPQSEPETIIAVQETEEEKYYRMAKEKHIPEHFAKEFFALGLFTDYIMSPDGFFDFSKETTEDGKYNLWYCYYALSEDSRGQAIIYLEDTETGKISSLPELHNDYSSAGILNNESAFVFYPYVGGACEESSVRFYKLSEPSEPYAVWEPLDGEFERDYISFYALCKVFEKDMLCAFWAKVPGGANDHDPPDFEGCTYTLSLIDANGKTVVEYDTKIEVELSRYGGFEHGSLFSVSENKIHIKIFNGTENVFYLFDISTGEITLL